MGLHRERSIGMGLHPASVTALANSHILKPGRVAPAQWDPRRWHEPAGSRLYVSGSSGRLPDAGACTPSFTAQWRDPHRRPAVKTLSESSPARCHWPPTYAAAIGLPPTPLHWPPSHAAALDSLPRR
jgi:hypothetical protein